MSKFERDWADYTYISLINNDISYEKYEKIEIKREKERIAGCCVAAGKIIGITNSSRKVLSVDTIKREVSLFGRTGVGTFKWTGGCEYKDKCFGFPRKSNSILIVDPIKQTLEERRLDTNYNGEHHYGGVLTSDGIIYQPPRNTDHVLRIDLNSFQTSRIKMPSIADTCRYSSMFYHKSGEIYMIPELTYRFAVLQPDTGKIEYFGEPSDHLIFGAVVGIDGNIYGFPKEGPGILKIDTEKKSASYICRYIENSDCYGSIPGINGKIYGVPGNGNIIWEFDVVNQTASKLFELEEEGYAKCAGAAIGPNGTIVLMPCFGKYVYLLFPNRPVNGFESFVHNRFFNTSY